MNLEYPKKSAYYCVKVHCMVRFLLAFFCVASVVNDCISQVVVGADNESAYLSRLQSKRLALVVNQTSRKGDQHVVDALWEAGLDIDAIFAPEHGFRGDADAGERVEDASLNKIPVYSLYGSSKKPSAEQLEGIDLVVFDIQDVGVR
ncbi:MAG: exo-beta-N-acetylmuramidase NamZ domain-containing protein, partial [Chitinophagales bacterium]